jgi:CubicO group peptidase (beta-lactamase class C family)
MRRSLALLIALTLGFTPVVASAAPRAQPMDTATRIDSYIRGQVPNLRVPGISLVVVEGDQVLLSRGYGFADREAGTPMTADTPVQIASANKGMIAMALMQLVEQGRVDLDAPVVRYLPDFSMDDERAVDITVRQVLSHTSGIPASVARDEVRDDEMLNREVASLANVQLHFSPGTGYEYANDGYSVALLILQTVSGMPYAEYISTQVFQPLQMARSTFDASVANEWGLTTSYAKRSGVIRPGPMALYPAGGILTTAGDVGHYLVALLNGGSYEGTQVVSPTSVAQMWTPEPASGAEAYGFGWGEVNTAGMRLLSHAGDIGAAGPFGSSGSQLLIYPERNIAIGVLANMSSLEKGYIAEDALAIMLGGEPAARPVLPDWRQPSFMPNRDAWASIEGDYHTSDGVMRVYRDGGKLLGSVASIHLEFVPQSDTSFVMLSADLSALDEVPAEFQHQPDGSVIFGVAGRPFAVKK